MGNESLNRMRYKAERKDKKNESKRTESVKQEAQKRATQQRERSKAAGLDSGDLTPLNLLKRDAITGTTTRDKILYSEISWTAGRPSPSELKAKNKKAGEERAARDQKSAAQVLSRQDKRLSNREQTLIRDAKTSYDEAREKGDQAGIQDAHKRAENIRKGHGYSGGVTGQESISPELTHEEKVLLNKTGQERLKMAKMNLEAAKTAGNKNEIAAAVQSGKVSNKLLKEFLSFSSSYNEDGEGALTQKEVAKALRDMDITNAERLALYATHGWKTSYSAALKKK